MFSAFFTFMTKLFNALGKGADIIDHMANAGVSLAKVAEATAGEYEDESTERRTNRRAERAALLGVTVESTPTLPTPTMPTA